jgi:RIO kinase 2
MSAKNVRFTTSLDHGYKLTFLGYDYLAIHTFMKRGVIKDVIGKIGVGK